MKAFFLALCSACFVLTACSQNAGLLQEAGNRLKNDEKVSDVLTDKKFFSIHPDTEFRELIKENAEAEILKIAPAGEPGKSIRVLCTITDRSGNGIADALVYLYQTDSKGWYIADAPHVTSAGSDVGHARLFGYVKTDSKGQFELHTIKPSGYPQSDLPAHIHVHVRAKGYRNFVNEFLFDDDERLVGDIRTQSIQNKFMISKPETAPIKFEQQFSYKIVLDK